MTPTEKACYVWQGSRLAVSFLYGNVVQGKTTNDRMDYDRTAFSPLVFFPRSGRAIRVARRWVRGGGGRGRGEGGGRVYLA